MGRKKVKKYLYGIMSPLKKITGRDSNYNEVIVTLPPGQYVMQLFEKEEIANELAGINEVYKFLIVK